MSGLQKDEPGEYRESNAGDGSIAVDHHMAGKELVLTLLACFLSQFVSALDQTIVTTTFSTVGNKFDAFEKVGWLNSAFLLPMCALCPTYGKLSIVFGRKATLCAGIVMFEIGSLVGALATSMDMLIGGRAMQGLGAGCIQTLVSIVVTESVPILKRLLSIAVIAVAYSIALVLGPFVGGALTTHVSWRWCFYINLPFGALALALLCWGYHPPRPKMAHRLALFDPVASVLLAAGLVLPLTGLTLGGDSTLPWDSAAVVSLVVVGGVVLGVFAGWNFAVLNHPLVLRQCVAVPQILCAACAGFCNFAMFLCNVTYLIIYFQVILGHSAWQSGIDLIPLVVTVTLTAIFNGVATRLTRLVKPFYLVGGAVGVVGTALIAVDLRETTPTPRRVGYLILMGVSLGFLVQCTLLSCQIRAPQADGSLILVTTFVNFMRFLGGTVGVTVATILFQSVTLSTIGAAIPLNQRPGVALQLLSNPASIDGLPAALQRSVYAAIMWGLTCTFYMGFAFLVCGFLFSVFATNKRVPRTKSV